MFRKVLLSLISILTGLFCFSQNHPPRIEEVAAKFYNTYDLYSLPYPTVGIEKRKTDWKIVTKKYDAGNLADVDTFLFYDGSRKEYLKLPLAAKTDTAFIDYKNYIDVFSAGNYTLNQYYGYRGWYKDVIANLDNEKYLSDSALYSLARAYSAYARSLLTDQTADALTNETFALSLTPNCMSKQQINTYHAAIKKAIDYFEQLNRKNPAFETIVGKIGVKYANEIVIEFHSYLTYAGEYAHSFSLPDNLYPDSIIEKTKRVLDKCPKDAILLSFGDNDFYPVLYAQQKLGFRKDVYLINYNLIGMDRYIFMTSQPQFQSPFIKLSVSPKDYRNHINDYLFIQNNDSTIQFDDVIDIIKTGKKDENNLLNIPGKKFAVKRNIGQENVSHVYVEMSSSYLLKNDWILMDILNNLDGRKLVCQGLLYDALSPLNNYLTPIDENLFVF
ncbi:hypothetical protein ACI6Q2_06765 [Chitinophagaceae bacterium LWZ2-11]